METISNEKARVIKIMQFMKGTPTNGWKRPGASHELPQPTEKDCWTN
jgi:hypothetical protein